jgi:hypothetical protein
MPAKDEDRRAKITRCFLPMIVVVNDWLKWRDEVSVKFSVESQESSDSHT